MKLVVLGEGAWGSAIASLIAHNQHEVTLWCYHSQIAQQIKDTQKNNRYCSYYEYSPLIKPTSCIDQALQEADIVFNALPIEHTRSVLGQKVHDVNASWVALNKGIECGTSMLPTQLLYDITGAKSIGVLMGPSFAQEVINKKNTFVNSAANNQGLLENIQHLLSTDYFYIQPLEDMNGMQWCSALKNCIALGMGLLATYGHNIQAAFMSKALTQLQSFLRLKSANPLTLHTFAGIGDILLTSYGLLSKNNHIGRLVGAGQSLEEALRNTGYVPEGLNTLRALSSFNHSFTLLSSIKSALEYSDSSLLIDALKTE